jgi:hypothetical protein
MKNVFLFLVIYAIQFYPNKILSQDSLIISRIKNIVGDTIDTDERNYYQILPQISGFSKAVIQLNSKSLLDFRIFYIEENTLKDSIYRTVFKAGDLLEALVCNGNLREREAKKFKKGKATILLKTGEIISGEILAIKSNEIQFNVQANNTKALEEYSPDHLVNKNEIKKIITRGKSNALLGGGIGLFCGVTIGLTAAAIISNPSRGDYFTFRIPFGKVAPVSCSIFGILCAIIGAVIGDSLSVEDRIFTIDQYSDLNELKKYLR